MLRIRFVPSCAQKTLFSWLRPKKPKSPTTPTSSSSANHQQYKRKKATKVKCMKAHTKKRKFLPTLWHFSKVLRICCVLLHSLLCYIHFRTLHTKQQWATTITAYNYSKLWVSVQRGDNNRAWYRLRTNFPLSILFRRSTACRSIHCRLRALVCAPFLPCYLSFYGIVSSVLFLYVAANLRIVCRLLISQCRIFASFSFCVV